MAHGPRLVLVLAVLLSAVANTVLANDSLLSERPSAVEPESAPSIRVLTWNVLAPSVLETLADALRLQSGGKGRAQRLNDRMKPTGPDIIGLQEVTGDFLGVVLSDPRWSGFHATVRLGDEPPGGLVVLSRFPILRYDYVEAAQSFGSVCVVGHTLGARANPPVRQRASGKPLGGRGSATSADCEDQQAARQQAAGTLGGGFQLRGQSPRSVAVVVR